MRIFCHTCRRTFSIGEKEIVYDNGSNMAVFKCPTCRIMYLAVDDDKTVVPRLMKLSMTKSFITDTEKEIPSKIIAPTQQRLVITPAEASALARQGKR